MYCSACGAENSDNSYRCDSCGAVLLRTVDQGGSGNVHHDPEGLGPAPDRLAFSIVVTMLCCWPFGIPAIVYAAKAMSANGQRDYMQAHEMTKKASTWCWVAFGVGCAVWGSYGLFIVLMMVVGAAGAAGAAGAP